MGDCRISFNCICFALLYFIRICCFCSFGNEELLTTLARLHDSLLPSLWRGFNIIYVVEDGNRETLSDMLSSVFISLNMLSRRIANFGWKILNYCYLSDDVFQGRCSFPVSMKMFPANVDDPATRADILIQSLRDLSANYSHVSGRQTGGGTFLQNIEKNHMIMSRIELLQNTGKIFYAKYVFYFFSWNFLLLILSCGKLACFEFVNEFLSSRLMSNFESIDLMRE